MSKLESYPTLEAAAEATGITPTKAMLAAWEASESTGEKSRVSVQLTEDGDAESRQLDVVTIKGTRKFDGCSVLVEQQWFRTPDNMRWRGYETETMVWLRGHRKWDAWLDEMPEDDRARYAAMSRHIHGETHDETIRWRNGNAGIWVLTGDPDQVRDRILAVCDERREARRAKVREARKKIESPTVRMGLEYGEMDWGDNEDATVWTSRCGEYRIVELSKAADSELLDCWIEQYDEDDEDWHKVSWSPGFETTWDVHEALEKHLIAEGRL